MVCQRISTVLGPRFDESRLQNPAISCKKPLTDIYALAMKPIVTRFTIECQPLRIDVAMVRNYHCIMKSPSLSALLQTHLVVPLLVLDGVAPSGSVTVVGEILFVELW